MNNTTIIWLGVAAAIVLLSGVGSSFYRRAKNAGVKGKSAADILETLQDELEKETDRKSPGTEKSTDKKNKEV